MERGFEIRGQARHQENATRVSKFNLPENSPQAFQQGALINGRYEVIEIVGEGGMGVVYQVNDLLRPEQPIALKTIRGLQAGEYYPQAQLINLNLFKIEFKTMTELHHPNLAAVYDFDAVVGTDDYFFTMELIPHAVNIFDATKNEDWKRVIDLLVPLCRVLSYVHSRGIIHFDIKPANVLLSDQDVVKVLDFGISGLKKLSGEKMIAGSMNYMAPEVGIEDVGIDHRADLYSLGILAYQLLTRSLPFKGSYSQVFEQHQKAPIVWNESAHAKIPLWLRNIVERLCAKNPADRFRTANNVIEEINHEGKFSYELETQKTRESYIFSSRFVGREKEFKEVTEFIQGRMKKELLGNPVLFVSGQSGIGKSRLFHEVKNHSQLERMLFIEGNCYEGRFNEYGAIAELISYLLPLVEAAGHTDLITQFGSELIKIEPQLVKKYSVEPSVPLPRPEAEHLRLREQVSEFFVRVADVMPYILYINDLQWAPAGTSDLIYYLAWRIILRERLGDSCPVALLGSFRGDEVDGRPLEKFLTRLREENVFRVIELQPLSPRSIAPMLCSMFGVDQLPKLFLDRVIQETAGNPFFVEEVMRTLVENGSVYIENGQWVAATKIEQLDFPTKISDVFLRRAALLAPEQRLIVNLLAVGDRPTAIEVLAKSAALVEGLGTLLTALERKQIIQSDGKKIKLAHDRMRETVYADIESNQRRDFHRRLGESIEIIFAQDLTPQLGALAYHFIRAQDRPKALRYSIAAGDDALERYANDLATSMYQQALNLLEPLDSRRRMIQEHLADAYLMNGCYEDAQTHFRQLLSDATDIKEKSRLHTKLGRLLFERHSLTSALDEMWRSVELRGEWRPRSRLGIFFAFAGALLEHFFHRFFPQFIRKSRTAETTNLYLERCATYGFLGEIYFFCDPIVGILVWFRATNCGEHVGDSKILSFTYGGGTAMFGLLTLFRTAQRYADLSMQMADRLDSDWHRGAAAAARSSLYLLTGEWSKAFEAGNIAIPLLKEGGDYFDITWHSLVTIHAALYLGKFQQAKKLCEETLEICQRTQVQGYSYLLAEHALINLYQGDHETAIREANQAVLEAQKDISNYFSLCFTKMVLGECFLKKGNLEQAIFYLEQAKTIREEKRLMHDWLVEIYFLLARAYLKKVNHPEEIPQQVPLKNIKKLIHKGKKLAKRHTNFTVPALITQAIFAKTKGNKKTAKRFFLQAIHRAKLQEGDLFLSQVRVEAAEVLGEDILCPSIHKKP